LRLILTLERLSNQASTLQSTLEAGDGRRRRYSQNHLNHTRWQDR
jgi:hypothetical protein